jgi:hypothetical protein
MTDISARPRRGGRWRTSPISGGSPVLQGRRDVVHELFGGELLKTRLPEGDHFYNRIDGVRFDFTESQFVRPIAYTDAPTTCDDAERGVTSAELAALRTAFLRHAGASD